MRAAIHETFGTPADVLTIAERPLPEPGPGEVRIRMRMAAIHNHDLLTVSGSYGHKPDLPAIGGTEAVGIIDALGEGVGGLEPGQRVAVSGARGTWAEFFVAKAASVVPVPDAVSDETGAQLLAMPLSALFLLDFVEAKPGDWLIQNAANGAVAKVLAKVAQKRGVKVVNLVRRASAVTELEALGIKNVVPTDAEGWRETVKGLTGGAPIKAGIDGVGGPAAGDMAALLGEGGTLVSFGLMSGKPMELWSTDLIFRDIQVKGFWLAKLLPAAPKDKLVALIGELVGLVASGDVQLQVAGVFDLTDIAKAAEASAKGEREGKVLVRG